MDALDITACDTEQIHIPGAVQPHGALLVLDRANRVARLAGGACESCLGVPAIDAVGRTVEELLGPDASALALGDCDEQPNHIGSCTGADGREWDIVAHALGDRLVLEAEPAPVQRIRGAHLARSVEAAAARFALAGSLAGLCDIAAREFRAVTGFDRVMVYRFLPDDSGNVVAEAKAEQLPTFLNHRYPASDIPRQARDLYVRNVIRVIPDAGYRPCDLVGASPGAEPLDMSHCHLRSVSPIHLQYLCNMGVVASASISLLREGRLWGLIACHHGSARGLSSDDRTLCRLMAADLSLRIAGFEDAELLNGRLRSRALEDELLARLGREGPVERDVVAHAEAFLRIVPAHGLAIRQRDSIHLSGRCPGTEQVRALGDWLLSRGSGKVYATEQLDRAYGPASDFHALASGLLGITVSRAEPIQFIWFRAEQMEIVSWAGNPHKAATAGPSGKLTPRKSFELWQETVRGRSEGWTMVEIEAAERIARAVDDLRRRENLDQLNASLKQALIDRDSLLQRQQYLLREGDHRIQNSLQILSGTLSRQLRLAADPQVRAQLEEALGRVHAVSGVHRRLFRANQPHIVQFDTYLQELLSDIAASIGEGWANAFRIRTDSVPIPTEMALSIGLVVTELLLNAVKYAYEGRAGPIEIELKQHRNRLVLSVRDWGQGMTADRAGGHGFGSRLMTGLLERLNGEIHRSNAEPGVCVIVEAPLQDRGQGHGTPPA